MYNNEGLKRLSNSVRMIEEWEMRIEIRMKMRMEMRMEIINFT